MHLLITAVLVLDVALVELEGPSGQEIFVNPHEVTSLRSPRGMNQGHFSPGTRCVVVMTNGNILAATQPCANIRRAIEAAEEQGHS
jgi:hypothetical protein